MTDGDNLVERLAKRLTLRFAGDCKCHNCQLVNSDDLTAAVRIMAAVPDMLVALKAAQECIGLTVGDRGGVLGTIAAAIAKAEAAS